MNIGSSIRWTDDRHFRLADTDFMLTERMVGDGVCMKKNRPYIEEYEKVRRSIVARNIVEVGVLWGGSTIFLNELFKPDRLLALDMKDQTQAFFRTYMAGVTARGITTQLAVFQDDKVKVAAHVTSCFGAIALDLVVDDASHLYEQSAATFEVLFPLLREDGVYMIEDWGWAHWPGMWQEGDAPWQHRLSMVNMLAELGMACASKADIIRRVEVTPTIITVHRGAGAAASFSLRSGFQCRGRAYLPYL